MTTQTIYFLVAAIAATPLSICIGLAVITDSFGRITTATEKGPSDD